MMFAAGFVALEDIDHSFSGPGIERMTSTVVPWLVEVLGL